MLVVVSVTLCLCVLAIAATAKVIRYAAVRLGVEIMDVLLWFGLAEWPAEAERPARRRSIRVVRRPRMPQSQPGTGSTRRPAHP